MMRDAESSICLGYTRHVNAVAALARVRFNTVRLAPVSLSGLGARKEVQNVQRFGDPFSGYGM